MSGQTKLLLPSGGSVTIAGQDSASNFVATLPANTGTVVTTGSTAVVSQAMLGAGVAGNGPAFSAKLSTTQVVSHNVTTKLTFNTEVFDTNGNFDSTTNYRFTPTVAGYYQVNLIAAITGAGGRNYGFATSLYKNGSESNRSATSLTLGTGADFAGCVYTIIYMNGSTDYLEAYFYQYDYTTLGAVNVIATSNFSAALVRAA